MPELPEVENVAVALRANLAGRTLTGWRVRFGGVLSQPSRDFRRALLGKPVTEVHRHGKYLLLTFGRGPDRRGGRSDDRAHLMIHLRMTGQLFVRPDYRPDKHVHLRLDFGDLPVYYRDIRKFGRFTLVDDGRHPSALAHVGPDMLEVGFRAWHERVAERRAPVKTVLLDQGVAAGLGNIYADEALFRACIHPATAPADLGRADLRRLLRAAKSILRLAVRHGGTTYLDFVDFHGRPGNFRRKLRVYQRAGESCRDCGTALERLVIGGRSSHFCPRCQPLVR
jgi:formamidopyrimidine-DNA glycosylase